MNTKSTNKEQNGSSDGSSAFIAEAADTPADAGGANVAVPAASPPNGEYVAKARAFTSLRLAQNFDEIAGVSKVIVHVPVTKPNAQNWFRTHAAAEYRQPVALLKIKEENEVYIVVPELQSQLAAEISPHMLFTYITRKGVVGIWPVRLPHKDGRTDGWLRTAHEAAELATKRWVRIQANLPAGAFDVNVTNAALSEPEWPEISFETLLEKAFVDHVIDDWDHPVLRRLRGEV